MKNMNKKFTYKAVLYSYKEDDRTLHFSKKKVTTNKPVPCQDEKALLLALSFAF
mgnify:CR=1 FL=1